MGACAIAAEGTIALLSTLTASAAGGAAGLLACAVIDVKSTGLGREKSEDTDGITNLFLATTVNGPAAGSAPGRLAAAIARRCATRSAKLTWDSHAGGRAGAETVASISLRLAGDDAEGLGDYGIAMIRPTVG